MSRRLFIIVAAAVLLTAALACVAFLPAREGESASRPAPVKKSAAVLLMGDVMFDRAIRIAADAHGGYAYILTELAPFIASHDIAVFNLEGPVTANLSTSTGSAVASPRNYIFTFSPAAPAALRAGAGTTTLVADIGNNHIGNFSAAGIQSTQTYLTQNSIGYFGSPLEELQPLFLDTPAGPLALVSYNQFSGRPDEASSSLAAVKAAHDSGAFTILFAHWGEEYATSAPAYVKQLARQFVDAGADLVVGAHPHVVEEPDVYKDVPLYYSLGNAVFDQYWNTKVTCGLALSVTLREGALLSVREVPLLLSPSGITLVGDNAAGTCPVSTISNRRYGGIFK